MYHGYVEFYLEGKWVKATPAFNRELCERHHVAPLEFNGRDDSIFHPYNLESRQFMEYVADHGTYADIPVDMLVAAWKAAYGEERVQGWIETLASVKPQEHHKIGMGVWKAAVRGLEFERYQALSE